MSSWPERSGEPVSCAKKGAHTRLTIPDRTCGASGTTLSPIGTTCWDKNNANQLHPRTTSRSGDAIVRENPPHLRALRVLHRDLSDLPAARRRVGLAPRAHLPDEGHAGGRQA